MAIPFLPSINIANPESDPKRHKSKLAKDPGMENNTRHDPNPESTRPEEPELDLYTIPSYSSWFAWNDIHETERQALKEFFEGSSISRTPKIYKEYRDFIINKYREDPSRRLTFTEIRKSLVGDVTLLHKVFIFLETWGLINFVSPPRPHEGSEKDDTVRVEDGAPNGVRVVATPNSLRPLSAPVVKGKSSDGGAGEGVLKLPPLASYSDVFGDLKRLRCGNCGDCDSEYYEYNKVALISTMVGPQITAAAAEAAVAVLAEEMACPREIFDGDEINLTNGLPSPTSIGQPERAYHDEESEMKERASPSETQETSPKKNDVPLPLRIRAAVATGLGAAAAHAKLLAEHEEREIEHLVATIIEAQLKKLHSKIKHCEDAELLMKKEYAAIEDLREYIMGERINILRRTFTTGIPKLRVHTSVQSQTANLS